MALKDKSTTPANNNQAPPEGAPEGMLANAVNDTIRQLMADVKGGTSIFVETKADMTALDIAKSSEGNSVLMGGVSTNGDFGWGHFKITKTDISTEVTADPQGGIHAPFDSDPTGVAGGFIRQFTGNFLPAWFGAKGDDSNDDSVAINAAREALPSSGGTVFLQSTGSSYLQLSPIIIDDDRTTIEFESGAILKAGAVMDAQISIQTPGRLEKLQILNGEFDGNNLAKSAIEDIGASRLVEVSNCYFTRHTEYHIFQSPNFTLFSEFWWITNCFGIDAKGFYQCEANQPGRVTDTTFIGCIMFRPTEFFMRWENCQRMTADDKCMVGSQTATWDGGILIEANDSVITGTGGGPAVLDGMFINNYYEETSSSFITFPPAIIFRNTSADKLISGAFIGEITVNPANKVTAVDLEDPTTPGLIRQNTIAGVDGSGTMHANYIKIGAGVAYTRIHPNGAEGKILEFINNSSSTTVINGLMRQAVGKNGIPTVGAEGDKILNTSDGALWMKVLTDNAGSITGATQANPCSITEVAHGRATGDQIGIKDVVGMTELNDINYIITVTGVDTYTLNNIDSTSFTAYTSGGTATLVNYHRISHGQIDFKTTWTVPSLAAGAQFRELLPMSGVFTEDTVAEVTFDVNLAGTTLFAETLGGFLAVKVNNPTAGTLGPFTSKTLRAVVHRTNTV